MSALIRLRTRIAVLVLVGAVAVAAGVALLLSNTITLRNNADATIRSDGYLRAVTNVERLVIDAETGLRGYVITGSTLFLQPLRSAQSRLPAALAQFERAAANDNSFMTQAHRLESAARSYFTSYAPHLLATAKGSMRAARSLAETLAGKRLVDGVRAQTAALGRLVAAREAGRHRAARNSATRAIIEAVVVLVLLVGLTVAIGAILGRLIVGRELARGRSEHTSRILQQSLLPDAIPQIPGCEFAVRFRPATATDLVGGDFYDVFAVGENEWAIVIGDVCGKGAEAAAVTAMARWTLRSFGDEALAPEDALRRLNRSMLHQRLSTRFITVAYGKLTLDDEGARLSVASGGHPSPILVPADGAPVAVRAGGTLLGVWPQIYLDSSELRLAPGDSIVAYTDGVTDQGSAFRPSSPDDMLGDRPPTASANELADTLERFARAPGGSQRDDIAIVALRFTGQPGATEAPEPAHRSLAL